MLARAYSYALPFAVLISIAALVNGYLFRHYKRLRGVTSGGRPGWADSFDFSPSTVGGSFYGKLALISILGLFLELLMIRWISSELRMFAYFKTASELVGHASPVVDDRSPDQNSLAGTA